MAGQVGPAPHWQAVPSQVSPAGQVAPVAPHSHAPARQVSFAGQALPAAPQLSSSSWKSVQTSPAPQSGVVPLQQAAPQMVSPAPVQAQVPDAVQAWPVGHVAPVVPHSHVPARQVSFAGQASPAAPQFRSSVWKSVQTLPWPQSGVGVSQQVAPQVRPVVQAQA